MVLVPKQIYRPMEQNRGLRNNDNTYNHQIFDKTDKNKQLEKISYLMNVVGKQVSHMQKAETRSLPYTL